MTVKLAEGVETFRLPEQSETFQKCPSLLWFSDSAT